MNNFIICWTQNKMGSTNPNKYNSYKAYKEIDKNHLEKPA